MTVDPLTVLREALETAAIEWWEGKRPVGWRVRDHALHPHVNCASDSERKLASLAVALARFEGDSQPEGER